MGCCHPALKMLTPLTLPTLLTPLTLLTLPTLLTLLTLLPLPSLPSLTLLPPRSGSACRAGRYLVGSRAANRICGTGPGESLRARGRKSDRSVLKGIQAGYSSSRNRALGGTAAGAHQCPGFHGPFDTRREQACHAKDTTREAPGSMCRTHN